MDERREGRAPIEPQQRADDDLSLEELFEKATADQVEMNRRLDTMTPEERERSEAQRLEDEFRLADDSRFDDSLDPPY